MGLEHYIFSYLKTHWSYSAYYNYVYPSWLSQLDSGVHASLWVISRSFHFLRKTASCPAVSSLRYFFIWISYLLHNLTILTLVHKPNPNYPFTSPFHPSSCLLCSRPFWPPVIPVHSQRRKEPLGGCQVGCSLVFPLVAFWSLIPIHPQGEKEPLLDCPGRPLLVPWNFCWSGLIDQPDELISFRGWMVPPVGCWDGCLLLFFLGVPRSLIPIHPQRGKEPLLGRSRSLLRVLGDFPWMRPFGQPVVIWCWCPSVPIFWVVPPIDCQEVCLLGSLLVVSLEILLVCAFVPWSLPVICPLAPVYSWRR